ncbi:hypothetical protein [Demequina lutea]|uniref:Uncharacterized protein YjbI with pentapeptide repeats n=1 Tax=Demequina lutea TaxID=431489 RepID=A0A7Z0CKY0_9MICO|nr:hypothetical protein [Demequina lutea]NYI42317.1 uncharacterized protein YjbI with pentapeptide repeats [Demequina lutea]
MTEREDLQGLAPALPAELIGRAEWDGMSIDGADLSGVNASRVHLIECAMTRCHADTLELPGLVAAEVYVGAFSAGTWRLKDSEWRDATWADIRVGALMADNSSMVDVTIRGSKIDLFSLRGAKVKHLTLTDCRVGTLDISMSKIDELTMSGGTVGELLTDDARMKRVDVSETEVHAVGHPGSLRGLVVSPAQMIDMAEALATHLGIVVRTADD